MTPVAARKFSQSGSAVIYALVVIAAGAFVLAGWIWLMSARASYVEQMNLAVQRRVTLENSRQLASQYLLQNVLPGTFTTGTTVTMTSVVSGSTITTASFTIPTSTAVVPLTSANTVSWRNGFAPGGNGGYTQDFILSLTDGQTDTSFTWFFRTRSRSPIFGYDLLTSQRPANIADTIDFSSGLHIAENVVVWPPASVGDFDLRTGTYQTPSAGSLNLSAPLNGAGQTVVMSNFAFLPVTSGGAYDGTMSVIDPGGGAPNSVMTKNAMASAVSIVGSATNSYSAPDIEAGGSSPYLWSGTSIVNIRVLSDAVDKLYIPGNTSTLVLNGQTTNPGYVASGTFAPLLILVNDSTNTLQTIRLQNDSNRLFYLAVKKPAPGNVNVSVVKAGAATWRLAGVFENTSLTISAPNGLNVVGGLRTNGSVVVAGAGTVNIFREATPNRLDEYADRMGWLESYRQ